MHPLFWLVVHRLFLPQLPFPLVSRRTVSWLLCVDAGKQRCREGWCILFQLELSLDIHPGEKIANHWPMLL